MGQSKTQILAGTWFGLDDAGWPFNAIQRNAGRE